ncbi:MAG: hypothetical protein HY821_17880 [Acidobacteria bacterium]|nr:hypothetical protein [Acidobacteriota bacterium]
MSERSLSGLLLATALFLPLAGSDLPRGGELGKRWKARDWTPSFQLDGTWERIGTSNRFQTMYTDRRTRQALNWEVTVVSIQGQNVTFKATLALGGKPATYQFTGRIQPDARTIKGKGGWCTNPNLYCGFEVVADWPVAGESRSTRPGATPTALPVLKGSTIPGRATPGQLWKVRDTTAGGFDYEGTWTFNGEFVRFDYRERTTGAKASGTMDLLRWDGLKVEIRNLAASRTYQGTLQADGKTISGTSPSCKGRPGCGWSATIEK